MNKWIATNIKWDMDDMDSMKLPDSIELPNGMEDEDEISDYLSEQTGYCHKGFELASNGKVDQSYLDN